MTGSMGHAKGPMDFGFAAARLTDEEKQELAQLVDRDILYFSEFKGIQDFPNRSSVDVLTHDYSSNRLGSQFYYSEIFDTIYLVATGAVSVSATIAVTTRSVRVWLDDTKAIIDQFVAARHWLAERNKQVYELPETLLRDIAHRDILDFVKKEESDLSWTGYVEIRRRTQGDKNPGLYQYQYQSIDENKRWRVEIDGLGVITKRETFPGIQDKSE